MSQSSGVTTPDELTNRLFELLSRQFAAVKREDVEHFLPLLLLSLSASDPTLELPPVADDVLGRFAERAGIDPQAPSEAIAAAVAAHYETNPVSDTVRRGFEHLLRELGTAGDASAGERAYAALFGARATSVPPQVGEARPDGTTAAGPLARFNLDKKT